jgi:bifunctional non-homologous end joining protein LigD
LHRIDLTVAKRKRLPTQARRRAARGRKDSTDGGPAVGGIRISHPDRLIYPDLRITKLQFARYFEAIGPWMLPHVKGRPLTLVHCPAGIGGTCAYLKHAKAWGPTALRRVRIREKTKIGEYLVADTLPAVVALAQMGVVEIHTWNSTAADVERPNRIVWDLDPGPEVDWTQVVAAARLLRAVLDTLGLVAWVKTTGGRGLHVVVPIEPSLDWSECLAFSRDVAVALVGTNAALYATTFRKRGREDRILIDYLRNNRTNTSISAYSPRARAGAPVSMPVEWSDLARGPHRWTFETVPARLRQGRTDPWREYWTARQRVSKASMQALRRL